MLTVWGRTDARPLRLLRILNVYVMFITTRFVFTDVSAPQVLNHCDFLTLSESLVQQIMCRPLEVSEIRKFQAMIKWATNKSQSKTNAKEEFHHIMTRLKKDINLVKIAPNDLINVTFFFFCTATLVHCDVLYIYFRMYGRPERVVVFRKRFAYVFLLIF